MSDEAVDRESGRRQRFLLAMVIATAIVVSRSALARLGVLDALPDGNTALGVMAEWVAVAIVVTPVVLAYKWLTGRLVAD